MDLANKLCSANASYILLKTKKIGVWRGKFRENDLLSICPRAIVRTVRLTKSTQTPKGNVHQQPIYKTRDYSFHISNYYPPGQVNDMHNVIELNERLQHPISAQVKPSGLSSNQQPYWLSLPRLPPLNPKDSLESGPLPTPNFKESSNQSPHLVLCGDSTGVSNGLV